jgi:hypothetical protein
MTWRCRWFRFKSWFEEWWRQHVVADYPYDDEM